MCKTSQNGTNFPVCDKQKTCIWNAFGYSEQYKKKSGSMTVKRRKLVKYYHLYFYSIDVNEENRRIKFESE